MTKQVQRYSFWLTFDRYGTTPRTTLKPPALSVDERAMQCSVELPISLFTRPSLKATIQVPSIETAVPEIDVVAAETVLSEVLGAEVLFEVIPPEAED